MDRRSFVKKSLAAGALLFVPGIGFYSCTRNVIDPTLDPIALNFCSPVDVPEEQGGFYVQFIEGREYRPSDLSLDTWRLRLYQTINGNVIREVFLTFDEIATRYPLQEDSFFQTLQCVGNAPGGFQASNGYFSGVPLRLFLENDLGVDWDQAERLYFRCYDDYHTNHRKERIINDDPAPAYLCYKYNGILYSERRDGCLAHGYPVRMIVPDMLGMKSPKTIMEIEVSDRDEIDGYWESRPVRSTEPNILWADIPKLQINSRLYEPTKYQKVKKGATFTVSGVAFSGVNPVSKVEVGFARVKDRSQVDGDIVWQDANILPRPDATDRPAFDDSNGTDFNRALQKINNNPWPTAFVWCLWQADIQIPDEERKFGVYVRSTDTNGTIQPFDELTAIANSDGNNAVHRLIIQAE